MSIASRHAYRFKFLKSDKWSCVRLEALAREKGKCQICGEESLHNDAHHIWYPEDIYKTTADHLVILCRPCHEFIHVVRPECKTRNESKGLKEWEIFKNAVAAWRAKRNDLFSRTDGITTITPQLLLNALTELQQWLGNQPSINGKVPVDRSVFGKQIRDLKNLARQ